LRRGLSAGLLLALGLITWWRQPLPPANHDSTLRLVPIALPAPGTIAPLLGPLSLQAIWQIKSRNSLFSGYSGLVPLADGAFLAVSDRTGTMRFRPPGALRQRARFARVQFTSKPSRDVDAEAATRDPASGAIWIATESSNAVARFDSRLQRQTRVWPEAMKGWNQDRGPEAMTRLPDGRFLILAEGTDGLVERRRHQGLLFPRDPTLGDAPLRFAFLAPATELPTDMAALPDGRVLLLLRRINAAGFSARIMVGDPAEIRADGTWRALTVAILAAPIPRDNFEAMTVTPAAEGKLTLWVMSDDNGALFQRTLLLKLALDPAKLPRRKKARESLARPPVTSQEAARRPGP